MQLIRSSGGSESGAGRSDRSEFSASPLLWGGYSSHSTPTPAWSRPVRSESFSLLWHKVTGQPIPGPGRGISQWLLLEGGEGMLGLFHLMSSDQADGGRRRSWFIGRTDDHCSSLSLEKCCRRVGLATCFYCKGHRPWAFGLWPSRTTQVEQEHSLPVTHPTSTLL